MVALPGSVRHELLRRRRQVLGPLHVRRLLRPLLLRLLAIGQVVVAREVRERVADDLADRSEALLAEEVAEAVDGAAAEDIVVVNAAVSVTYHGGSL